MADVYLIPLESGRVVAWPSVELPEPYPDNCTEDWVEPDKPVSLRGMKSNAKSVLCVGGPLHRIKLRRLHKINKKTIDLVGTKPFTVPPFRGRYHYNETDDRFEWKS